MKITYLGHASFHVLFNDVNLIIDPYISPNPQAEHIDIDALKADYILVSHGHGDHVADVERIAKNTDAKIISNFEITTWFQNKGLSGHPLNHGGKISYDFGTIKYVNAVHTSSLPDGSNGGNPGGFVIWSDIECLYFAGDTALTMDMKLIPMTCPQINVAILPIGDNFTMGYEEALLASDFIECNNIIPCHYDTFGLIEVDRPTVESAFTAQGKKINFLSIGDSKEV